MPKGSGPGPHRDRGSEGLPLAGAMAALENGLGGGRGAGHQPQLMERTMMGQTSKKLHRKLTKMAAPLDLPTGKMEGRGDMPNVERWINEGMDPVHAAYAFVQNI